MTIAEGRNTRRGDEEGGGSEGELGKEVKLNKEKKWNGRDGS